MSGRTILVGNEKGGCGKTTVAVNIAAMAALDGLDVLLVDADPGQQSAARWVARRRESHPDAAAIRCVSLRGASIRTDLEDLRRRYGIVVVDTGAEDSVELRAAAVVASVLVVPVQPESLDLWTMPTMETLVERARSFNTALDVVVVLNRIPHQTVGTAPAEVGRWLTENVPGLPVSRMVPLVGRTAYGRATGEGLGVAEMPRRDPRATSEVINLWDEVKA